MNRSSVLYQVINLHRILTTLFTWKTAIFMNRSPVYYQIINLRWILTTLFTCKISIFMNRSSMHYKASYSVWLSHGTGIETEKGRNGPHKCASLRRRVPHNWPHLGGEFRINDCILGGEFRIWVYQKENRKVIFQMFRSLFYSARGTFLKKNRCPTSS